ncbi:hypothetical protein [Streptomyces sp. NPDC058694]|uniref:hypothetical protein n=1 Tax=Streptomyces sp. NPDC058694 TaxID=3346603 RepID=UPI00365FDAD9
MRTWSDSPFRAVVQRHDVPATHVIAEDNGESTQVHEIAGQPGWLAKLYRRPLTDAAAATLQTLVYLPTVMSQQDRDLVDRCVSWPVARICDGPYIVGVVMAKAPDRFYARLHTLSGRTEAPRPLPLDWMVTADAACIKRGIQPANMVVRSRAMTELLQVGALFARHDVVYADWSYSNAFWEQGTGAVFIIDMDTSGIGTREWIESPEWEDPLYPETSRPALTVHSDRYKLAVLTVRCLTGERRDPLAAHQALLSRLGNNPFHTAVGRALTAAQPAERPTPQDLFAALDHWMGTAPGELGDVGTTPSGASNNVTGSIDLRARIPAPVTLPPRPPSHPPVQPVHLEQPVESVPRAETLPAVPPPSTRRLGKAATTTAVIVCLVFVLIIIALASG